MTTPEAGHRHLSPRRRRARHFLLQLLPVTAGILIALLIASLVEMARERSLVQEARTAIAAEIAGNANELKNALPTFAKMQEDLATVATIVNDILNTGRTSIDSYGYNMNLAGFSHASWQTAERTNALGYMEYDEVRKYADLYALQELVEDSQRDLLPRLAKLGIVRQATDSGDPESYVRDLQDARTVIAEFEDALAIHISLASDLASAYQDFSANPAPAE